MIRLRSLVSLALLAGCSGSPPPRGDGETSKNKTPDASAEEGRKAFEQGLAAVQRQDWDLAIGYFDKAREAEPSSPNVLFNLGLAHAKAQHEIPAIAWLKAYLISTPDSENAPEVRAEIQRLESAARERAKTLIDAARAAARKLPQENDREYCLRKIAELQAEAGDIQEALETVKGMGEETVSKVWAEYGKTLARRGDVRGVEEVLPHCRSEEAEAVQTELCGQYHERGDLAAARKLAMTICKGQKWKKPLIGVLLEYVKLGDFVPVDELLSELELEPDEYPPPPLRRAYALKQADLKNFGRAGEIAGTIRHPASRAEVLAAIAIKQLEARDVPGAKTTAKEILALGEDAAMHWQDGTDKSSLVAAAAILGNYEGAVALIREMGGLQKRTVLGAFGIVAFAQALSGDLKGAEATVKAAPPAPTSNDFESGFPKTAIVRALVIQGKLDEAERYLQLQKDRIAVGIATVPRELADARLQSGDPAGAERVWMFWVGKDYGDYDWSIRLAAAYGSKRDTSAAIRVLKGVWEFVDTHIDLRERVEQRWKQITEMLRRFGGQDPKRRPATEDRLAQWNWFVRRDMEDADLKKSLQKMQEETDPTSIPPKLAECAMSGLLRPLDKMREFEEKYLALPQSK